MLPMPIADLEAVSRDLADTGDRVRVLWQRPESLAFVACGREYRSEFHINPSDEVMYMVRGTMQLHFRTPDGKEEIAELRQGELIYTAGGVPHSPRFSPDAFLLVIERKRCPGEIDRFRWYCDACDRFLHEEAFVVSDYALDPVSKAYKNSFESTEFRTCGSCGTVKPSP